MPKVPQNNDPRNLLDGVDVPPGVTSLNLVIRNAPPPVVNIRDAAAICGSTPAAIKAFAKRAKLASTKVGHLDQFVWDDFIAAIRRLGAPVANVDEAPRPAKTIPRKGATTAEILAANGLRVVGGGK